LPGGVYPALQPAYVRLRLVMTEVDLCTVQVLGDWRTLAMVQRYSHLASTTSGMRSSG
jgi:hypothetical protein